MKIVNFDIQKFEDGTFDIQKFEDGTFDIQTYINIDEETKPEIWTLRDCFEIRETGEIIHVFPTWMKID